MRKVGANEGLLDGIAVGTLVGDPEGMADG